MMIVMMMSSVLSKLTAVKLRWLVRLTHPLNTLMHERVSSWQNSLELLQTYANFVSEKIIHNKCGGMKILSTLAIFSQHIISK